MHDSGRVRLRCKPFCCQSNMQQQFIGSLFNSFRTSILYTLPCRIFLLRWNYICLRWRKNSSFYNECRSMFKPSFCRRYCCVLCCICRCYLPCWYLLDKFCNNLCSLCCRILLQYFSLSLNHVWEWHKSCCGADFGLCNTSNILLSKNSCNNFIRLWSLLKRKILFFRYSLHGLYH